MSKSDRLRRNYIHFVTIRQQRGLNKKLQKLPASCYDKHHIQPKSCGGGDEPSNLVLLTFREHWVAHYLLDQFSEGGDKRKMQFALSRMSSRAKPGELPLVAYAIGKVAKSEALAALVAAGKHNWQTEEHRAATSKRQTDLAAAGLHPSLSAENRAALAKRTRELAAIGGHPAQSEENRAATSKRMTGLTEAGLNPLLSAENRAATSKRYAEQVTCPHCSKTGQKVVMSRWHYDNCKHNPASKRYIAKN